MNVSLDLLGAIVAHVILVSSIVTFAARMLFHVPPGHWVGAPLLMTAIPLAYLLTRAPGDNRPVLYFVQVGLMLGWIVLIFLLDYVLHVQWRDVHWAVVTVVVLYFGGTGGMIGLAAYGGGGWTVSAAILFLVGAVVAFGQRATTEL